MRLASFRRAGGLTLWLSCAALRADLPVVAGTAETIRLASILRLDEFNGAGAEGKHLTDLAFGPKRQGDGFFLKPTVETYEAMQEVAEWVEDHPTYTPATRQAFFNAADYYLVAHAAGNGFMVVTFEKDQPMSKNVKIPTVCNQFDVKCIDLHALTEREGLQL